MAIKTILFLLGFVAACVGALYMPLIGVVGYVLHYHLWPEQQWWGRPLVDLGLRYAFALGAFTFVGAVARRGALRFGSRSMWLQEYLLPAFFFAAVLASLGNVGIRSADGRVDQFELVMKLAKIMVFCLLLSHIVTDLFRVRIFLWSLAMGTLYLGYNAWVAPTHRFIGARLNQLGGPDFMESSFLGAHLVIMLPILGVLLMRSGRLGKLVSLAAGGLAVNGVILTQTRAAFVAGLVGMVAALVWAIRGTRMRVAAYVVVGLVVAAALTDYGFRQRMLTLLPAERSAIEEQVAQVVPTHPLGEAHRLEADVSRDLRLKLWGVALAMIIENPLGVGPGNFTTANRAIETTIAGRDVHNTYLRCAAEIGIPGLLVLTVIILNAFRELFAVRRQALSVDRNSELAWYAYGLTLALIVLLVSGIFISQTYVEFFWWILILPVCLRRAVENEYATALKPARSGMAATSLEWARSSDWVPAAPALPAN